VLLEGGSTILVKRAVKFNETNSAGGSTYNAVELYSTITFTGQLTSLPLWNQALMALVLYHDAKTGEWVVVATTTSCEVWQDRGEPVPIYWEFRQTPQGWRETPLSSASIGRPANLLHRYQSPLPSSHITVADRQRLESDPGIAKRYINIVSVEEFLCTRRTPPAVGSAASAVSKPQ
jgi:hypothetical protein